MRIAFYAPLKAPDHPVASGDRLMARLLMRALERAGHRVALASRLRAYLPDAGGVEALAALEAAAGDERARIGTLWRAEGAPDLWFCYHPYYKSPDLIGPALCAEFGIPWVSAEASLSSRRTSGIWAESQAAVQKAVAGAAVNFGITARDRAGLARLAPGARIAELPPFLELDPTRPISSTAGKRLVTVAMMRHGDKLDSYRALAAALRDLPGDWRLSVAGDGPARAEVQALFPPGRVDWLGALDPKAVAELLASGAIYVWPGCGEAYGLAYLEAQAAGLPVVAFATAGVPEVVVAETGLLMPPGDTASLSAAAAKLLADPPLRRQMGAAARARIEARHGMEAAARHLEAGLRQAMEARS